MPVEIVHEIGERDRHAVAAERGGELRVERARRHPIEAVREDLEIALQSVTDDRLARERGREAVEMFDAQRVDDRDLVADDELHDHQSRRIRSLVVEFRIERDAIDRADALAEGGEGFLIFDDGDVHECSGPGAWRWWKKSLKRSGTRTCMWIRCAS